MKSYILLLLLILTSCSNTIQPQFCMQGQEEFVMESQLIASGGHPLVKQMQGETLVAISEDDLKEYEDVIAEEDRLNIVVYHPVRHDISQSIQAVNDRLDGFQVSEGCVFLPQLGSIPVAGLTLQAARELVREEFRKQIKDTDVFISYRRRVLNKVELSGLAGISSYPVDGKVRLYEVLSVAHIPQGANLFASYLLRGDCQLGVDFYKLINKGDMSQNVVMRPGDKIFIGTIQDKTVTFIGEVGLPVPMPEKSPLSFPYVPTPNSCISVPVPYGSISLREAFAIAKGIKLGGDKNHIHVIRGGIENPRIYDLSWNFMLQERNDNLLLLPGDVVYVASTPIANWNYFVMQFWGTFLAIQSGAMIHSLIK